MPKEKQHRPRLIPILTVLLVLQLPVLTFLGLNLLTNRWSFLRSWPRFWLEFRGALALFLQTPGEYARDEILFYDVMLFAVLESAGVLALLAGLIFYRGKPIAWILGLLAQIGTLVSGLALYFLHQPSQAYWLLVLGIIMVMYLNYGDVRQWFLQADEALEEGLLV